MKKRINFETENFKVRLVAHKKDQESAHKRGADDNLKAQKKGRKIGKMPAYI